jgi:pyruvyl transferase EpsO
MTPSKKISELKALIDAALTPLIDNDYLLLDLPYHDNLGDSLIWQGTEDFLSKFPHKCLFRANRDGLAYVDCAIKHKNAIILLHGGGNFGDIYPFYQRFRREVIARFPDRKIIIMPQTIHYNNIANLDADAKFFAAHPDVIICVRDKMSLDLANQWFCKNKVLLVPDMAFYMDMTKYKRSREQGQSLFVKRIDNELSSDVNYSCVPNDAVVSDWPPAHRRFTFSRNTVRINYLNERFGGSFRVVFNKAFYTVVDKIFYHYIKGQNVRKAVKFLSGYKNIYATRMHAGILSVLLEKENTVMLDNSYGKNAAVYDTWLADVDGITLSRNQK